MRLLVLLLLLSAVFIYPCGPFLPDLEYAPTHGPVPGAEQPFARGQLGVLRPHFYREPLLLAYRQLSGVPLTAEEAAALYPPAKTGAQETASSRWLTARLQVPRAAKAEVRTASMGHSTRPRRHCSSASRAGALPVRMSRSGCTRRTRCSRTATRARRSRRL